MTKQSCRQTGHPVKKAKRTIEKEGEDAEKTMLVSSGQRQKSKKPRNSGLSALVLAER
ncbi:hypothetical protein [Craterilacuibacter sinensis]|uniref:Uncharacterized protein n=1 Tax=Craterilacuibacter sinensis TaxID=2686017 RepID=A0A845BTS3_9NEIS|nr:hypothetical protein [Craterilacuibacter sinensis]MXR37991.1 hypothetical protein [Craterilacuibacter sinensis]